MAENLNNSGRKIPRPHEVEKIKKITQQEEKSLHTKRNDKVANKITGLIEHDTVIKYYFDNVIIPRVVENGKTINVPIFYSSPEKWKSIQQDGFIRDEKNKIMVPLITYKRTSTDKDRSLSRNMLPDNPQLFEVYAPHFTPVDNYTKFSQLSNTLPQKELFKVVVPDYVILGYDCIIWTDQITQMNKLIEAILYAGGTWWGDEKHRYFAKIDGSSQTSEVTVGEDRAIQSTFKIVVKGHLIPDAIEKELAQKSEKTYSISQIQLGLKLTDSTEYLTLGGKKIEFKSIISTDLIQGSSFNYSSEILAYLKNNHKSETATVINQTIAQFTNQHFAPAPFPLPPTSINDFDFYVNGQHLNLETGGITFSDTSPGLILTIDPVSLGFGFDSTAEVIGVGRFL